MPLQTMVRSLGWLAALIWFCPNLGYPQIHVIISVLFLNWQFWGCGVYPILGTLISAEDDRFLQWQICWKGKAHHGIWHVVQQRFFFLLSLLVKLLIYIPWLDLSHWECPVSQMNTSLSFEPWCLASMVSVAWKRSVIASSCRVNFGRS